MNQPFLSASLLCVWMFTAAPSHEAPARSVAVPTSAASAAPGPNIFDGTLHDNDAVPELSTTALRDALNDPRVVVLDARPYDEFAKSHIPAARSVPGVPGLTASKYTSDANEVKKLVPETNRPLIVYCNGLYCGRSKRFAADLKKLGYRNVRRYQLGIPAWRALGGVTQVEKDALVSLLASDSTAVLVDARPTKDATPRLPRARWIPPSEATKAKDDGRLPMSDHNTRIFVVADDPDRARAAAEAIIRDAFHNVSFFAGSAAELAALLAKP
ncbi:MAG: rhodanese-like domain-containing protein [Myxococcota bacterium]